MSRTTVKVFLACAIGSFIGTVVALQVNQNFWWTGLLVGALVGYLAYEFKKVVAAVPVAWQEATSWWPEEEWWKVFWKSGIQIANIGLIVSTPLSIVFFFSPPQPIKTTCSLQIAVLVACIPPAFAVSTGFLLAAALPHESLKRDLMAMEMWPNFLRVYLWIIPQLLLWTVPKYLFLGIWLVLKLAPAAAKALYRATKALGRFFWHLLVLIHSENRLLCFVDAAIGVATGYRFFHSAILGALIGGLWGALNFEVLSIRVLKLVPKERSIFG
jgi:hypothetical protein